MIYSSSVVEDTKASAKKVKIWAGHLWDWKLRCPLPTLQIQIFSVL